MSYTVSYENCNKHIIEVDKKRDQIVFFYITLIGAFFSLANKDIVNNMYFSLILAILGIVLSRIILEYRDCATFFL